MTETKLAGIIRNLANADTDGLLATTAGRLASAIQADHLIIGLLDPEQHSCRTLAYLVDGEVTDNFEYPLKGTPCADVSCNTITILDGDVQQQYPQDSFLKEREVKSYIGIPLQNSKGKVIGILNALFTDNLTDSGNIKTLFLLSSELIASQIEHIESQQRILLANSIISNISEGIAVCDKHRNIVFTNQAFEQITGYSNNELVGKPTNVLRSDYHSEDFYEQIWAASSGSGRWSGEIWCLNKSGNMTPLSLTNNPLKDQQGEIEFHVLLISDITERKATEQKIQFQANYDTVTQLPNRHLFLNRLTQAIQHCKRNQSHCAVLFLDLDLFKTINDSLGHQAGDQLLKKVAQRLKKNIRESDTVGRLGGDEFTIILHNIESPSSAEIVADNILQQMTSPFQLDHHPVSVTASIGIAIYPDDGQAADQLLSHADQAMYSAKHKGKNCFSFFTSDMQQHAERRLLLKHQLEQALANDEITVAYQPIVNLQNGRVDKFEALARWRREEHYISPVEFIPVAEEFGMIPQIGAQVLEKSCQLLKQLHQAGFSELQFAINRSAREFPRPGEPQPNWLDVITQHQLAPSSICFEVTESILAPDNLDQKRYFNKLTQAGAQIAIDDFGTGYSSLSYLRKFPVDILKIDRSFIFEFTNREDDLTLVSTIIAMAKSLNLKVVAEGVEHQQQLDKLIQLGCNYVQGYYFSKPLEADQVLPYMEKWCSP